MLFRSPLDGHTTIPIRLGSYDDLFDPLDLPGAMRRVDSDVEDRLEGALASVPSHEPLRILVVLPADAIDRTVEPEVVDSFRDGFTVRRAGLVEQVRNGHRRVVGLLLLGIVPLLAGHLLPLLLGKHRADGPIFGDLDWLVDNVLVIAAWVFVWEAVTTLVLTRRDLATSVGRIDRIVAADLVFRAERARSA